MPYQPTWNNPYLAQNPYQPVLPTQTYQPYQQQQSAATATQPATAQQSMAAVKVDGPAEAMNRFLMRYGYDMQGLREAMSTAAPEEREKMMREMRTMLGM